MVINAALSENIAKVIFGAGSGVEVEIILTLIELVKEYPVSRLFVKPFEDITRETEYDPSVNSVPDKMKLPTTDDDLLVKVIDPGITEIVDTGKASGNCEVDIFLNTGVTVNGLSGRKEIE
jgi:hypothetical protein